MDEKLLFCVSVREGDKMLHGAEWRETGQGRTLIDLFVELCGNKVLGQQVQVLVSKERSFLEAAVVPVCTPLSTLAEKTQSYIQYILKNSDSKPLPIKSEVSKRYEAEKEHDDKKDGDVDLLHNWKNFYSSKTFHIDSFGMTDHISNDPWLQSANHNNFLLKTSFENMTVEEICDEIKRMKAKEVSKSKLSSWIEETKKQSLGTAPSRPANKIVETGDKNDTPGESIKAHNKDSTRLSKCQNVSEPKNSKDQDSDSKTQTRRVGKIKPKTAPTVKRQTPVNTDRLAILAQPRKRFVNATKETKIPKKTNVTRKPVVKIKKKKPELKVSEGNTTPIRPSITNDNEKESKVQKAVGSTEQYFVEIFTNGISETQDHLQKCNEPQGEHTPSKEFLYLPEEKSSNSNSHNKKKTSTSNYRNPVHTESKDCNTDNRLSKIEINGVIGTHLENKDQPANSRESSYDINDILNELHAIQSVHGMQQNGHITHSDVASRSSDDLTSSKKTIGGYVKRENLSNFSLNSSEEEDVLFLKSPLVDCHWNSEISGDINYATSNHSTFVKQCSNDSLISPNSGSNTKPKIELSLDCHSLMTSSSDKNSSSTITSSLDLAKMSSTPIIHSCDASASPSAISQLNSLTSPLNGELWSNSRGVIFTKESSNSDNNRLRNKVDVIPNGSVIQQNDVPVETVDGGKKLITPHRSPQPSEVLEEHSAIPEKQNFMSIASENVTVIVHENSEKISRPEQQRCTVESPEKQRKHWGNKIQGMDAMLLASLQAFTLELRASTETVASQIRILYEDWRSKYETETSEDCVIAGNIINKPSPKQKEDGGQQQGMATIFRNLRKMEVNLKTMEQAAATMLTELREKDDLSKEKGISPQNGIQRTKSFKWKELKTAARTKIKTKDWLNEKLSSDSDSDG